MIVYEKATEHINFGFVMSLWNELWHIWVINSYKVKHERKKIIELIISLLESQCQMSPSPAFT